jgi:hypothetical protein
MDPYLEHPALWPDIHNRLIAAIADTLAEEVAPRYYIGLERRAYLMEEVSENFLEIHEVSTGELVTIIELLSPANKLHRQGRKDYEEKREIIFQSRTNLVEVDLLRAGEPMAVEGPEVQSDYRILVSRGAERPRARLFAVNLRQPIPDFSIPLLPGDEEPILKLGQVLHDLYRRARFDLRLDYTQAAVPPLSAEDDEWAKGLSFYDSNNHPSPI